MSLTPAARRWSAIIDEYESSGPSLREFARRRDVNLSTLRWWRSRLGRVPTRRVEEEHFAEVVVSEEESSPTDQGSARGSGALVIRLGGRDAEVVVERDTDLGLLRRVVEVLC